MKGFWNLTSTISLTLSILFLFGYNYEDVYAVPTTHLCRSDQRDALLQFKNEFQVINSSFAYNCYIYGYIEIKSHPKTESWVNNSDCCKWEGITCNAKSGEVIELDLGCSNLRGQFPSCSSLQNLHSLTTLNLSRNDFSGQIMFSIGNLSHLTSLDLSENSFSEFIPYSIVGLSYLTYLDLSYNRFSGQIPSSIGNLSKLTYLGLSTNDIDGEIPSSIGNLNHLTSFGVGLNRLDGSFPIALLNLTRLSFLVLGNNQIHRNNSSLYKLMTFDASNNAFTGTLPSSLFTLPYMDTVDLSDNHLNGILEFGNISSPPKLRRLYVGNNKLRGPIPGTISKFTNYKTRGPVDFSIFSHLIKLLEDLDISYLNTTTTIDLNDFLSYFKRLGDLVLSGNHVSATNKSPVSNFAMLRYHRVSGVCKIAKYDESRHFQQ